MKILRRLLVVLAVVLIVLVLGVMFFGGHMIKTGVEMVGPQVLGVPVTLEHVRLSPLRGEAHLRGLRVGNPEGFKTESLFDLGQLDVVLDLASLVRDTIIIKRIYIEAPIITYEQGVRRTNIGTLLRQLETAEEPPEDVTPEEPAPEVVKPGKKVVIEELIIADGRLNASLPGMAGKSVPLKLPRIEMKDLGKEKEPLTIRQALREVIAVIASSAGVPGSGGSEGIDSRGTFV